jgi:ParB family transcriptional regulator, chromosome partitioning protein
MNRRAGPIREIPIATIAVLNPRTRDRNVFREVRTSIAHLGLKRPVTVSTHKGDGRYELVCGQGRIEAFTQLGADKIPALLVDVSTEDCLLMGLVENLARGRPSSIELVGEIGRLAKRYKPKEIAEKLDFSPEYVTSICHLLRCGEERLLEAVEKKRIPHSIAIEIARAKDSELQGILVKACETAKLSAKQIAAIRKLAEQRRVGGEKIYLNGRRKREIEGRDAATLLRAYRQETERKRVLIKKAELAQTRLLFVVNALRTLLKERMFVTLLREESLQKLPLPLMRRIVSEGA